MAQAGFPYELYLVPLVLLLTIGGLYLLTRALQKQTQNELEQLRRDGRLLETRRRPFRIAAQEFAADEQEPFRSHVQDLWALLDEIERQIFDWQAQRAALNQRANDLSMVRWRVMMGAPYLWYFLRRDVKRLRQEMVQIEQLIDAAAQKETEIRRVGWDVAQQAKRALQMQQKLHQMLESLYAKNVRGDVLDEARWQADQARGELEKIPTYLYHGSEESILARTDRATIVQAHQIIVETQPILERLLEQAQLWESQARRAEETVDALGRALEDASLTLNNMPAGIETTDYRAQFDQLSVVHKNLNDTLTRLEVDGLPAVIAEAERLTRLAQEMGANLKRARREISALEAALRQLLEGFKQLSMQMAMLGARSPHPVVWRRSLDVLSDLNRQAASLAPTDKPRSPEQVGKDLQIVASLRASQKELAQHCQQIEQAHTQWTAMLTAPDFGGLQTWLEGAKRLAEEIQGFAVENWSRAEAIENLPVEIDALERESERLDIHKPSEPVPEDQVLQRLEDTRQLNQVYQKLRRRVEQARIRLNALIETEKSAREQLEGARAALGQIEFIARSNEFLSNIAGQEIERQSREVQRLIGELDNRQHGAVERKARQAASLIERSEQMANRWLDQLIAEVQQQTRELTALLGELDKIADLEERAIGEARRVLSSSTGATYLSHRVKSDYSLEKLPSELKRHSDFWHSCNAAIRSLEDFHPLIETFREAQYQLEKARQSLKEASTYFQQKRSWPPTSVSFDSEMQELEKIQAQWQELRASKGKAIARVAQLGNLSARSQALVERVAQIVERAAHEQGEAEELEAQINELIQLWQNLLYEYGENEQTSQEIRGLLETSRRDLAQMRRAYLHGSADYVQTLQAMKALHKRLRYYQVALDEESALDVQGNVQRRRESRRV
jgi:hypothetical protein